MIQLEDILSVLRVKNPEAIPLVIKSYKIAEQAHQGVLRESGEPYITHPLHVAKNLLDMEIYDGASICAAILHDVVEDSDVTLEDIEHEISKEVSELVDGVTKMRRMNFSSKQEQSFANTRKIITSLNKDVRIIIIKLADRLHNMRTLEYKRPEKQIENADETMKIFVPLALSLGAYQIKSELEDIALSYLEPTLYADILGKREELGKLERAYFEELRRKINAILQQENIPSDILIRTQNICKIYRAMKKGFEVENIYDLYYLKILVDEVNQCFTTLGFVHQLIRPINGRLKDYIYSPRTNHYQSLHTTGSDSHGKLVKTKVRTHDMDKVSAFGITAYWNIDPNKKAGEFPVRKTHIETQEEIRHDLQFAKRLKEMDSSYTNDQDFIERIQHDLLSERVYVYNHSGETIELTAGSTALDYACQEHPELLEQLTGVLVNGKQVPLNTVLENNDTVQVLTNGIINREDWPSCVHTKTGEETIKRLIHRQNPA